MDRHFGEELKELKEKLLSPCLKLLALHQPTATDLRFITAGMKINSELERVGDQAVNISQNGTEYLQEPQLKLLIDISPDGEYCQ